MFAFMSCDLVLSAQGAVSACCIADQVNGCIVAGVQEIMRSVNPLSPKIHMYILLTVLHIFLMLLVGRI